MTEFNNVTVQKEANIYFEGKVISTSISFPDGSKKTLGVMLTGEYEFDTEQKEIMEIMSGKLEVLLPNKSEWEKIKSGDSFEVPKNSSFKIKIHEITNYCCDYIE
ncbi:MAG: pyrimidine/purine nucleoside phosphorylase [Chloroflexota bacterium]|nr:pyrimidine/purine nucleoside phosphorylase [Chloroflexota bacterium]